MDGPRAVVAGGSGFIGTALVEDLRASGYEVQILSRIPTSVYHAGKPVYWDGETVGDWKDTLESADLVVNLSGETVSQQWTPDAKRRIRDSRIKSTRAMGEASSHSQSSIAAESTAVITVRGVVLGTISGASSTSTATGDQPASGIPGGHDREFTITASAAQARIW